MWPISQRTLRVISLYLPTNMNIKFNYLYRDAANYKTFGFVVFSNPDGIDLNQLEKLIQNKLLDGEFFEPKRFGIPHLRHLDFPFDLELDHDWNEFHSVEKTTEMPTDKRTIKEFLLQIGI